MRGVLPVVSRTHWPTRAPSRSRAPCPATASSVARIARPSTTVYGYGASVVPTARRVRVADWPGARACISVPG
ncbi:hypothetical protein ACFQ0M_45150 [Kitasatospora aburaviensis]